MLSFIAQKRHMLFVQLPNWTSLGTIHVINSNFFWLTVFSIYVRFRLNSELIQCVYWMNICSFGSTSNGRQVAIQSEYKRNAEASGYHPTYGLLWFLNKRAENVDEEDGVCTWNRWVRMEKCWVNAQSILLVMSHQKMA